MSTDRVPLSKVIKVDAEKCVNCHICIGVCPTKYCNNASNTDKGIYLNDDLCIACGRCIKACTHEARIPVDDTERFLSDLGAGVPIAALVAPAIDGQVPGLLDNLLGWLKGQGVRMNFDVSFGAEITTYQYVKAIRDGEGKRPIIAQPCPSVVSYIQVYKPELLPYLAPVNSPAVNMAAWVHHNHPEMRLAFISPCIAKKREFEDPDTKGRIHYNVTIAELLRHLKATGTDLASVPPSGFNGPMEAERGILYSQPGGLHENLKRYGLPLERHQVRRVEGNETYEEFLDELIADIQSGGSDVVLVDILNCLHGCNRGTGTDYGACTTDTLLKRQDERLAEQKASHYDTAERISELEACLQGLGDIDFSRTYGDRSSTYAELEEPTPEMIRVMHEEMRKFTPKDIRNCGACGYMTCGRMAKAILNGLYRPEQCHHFLETIYLDSLKGQKALT